MKILKENKEKLPVEFITSFISQGWSEIGSLNTTIEDFKKNFSESSKLIKILEDLSDSYLIAIGQCQLLLEKKGFELPEEKEKTESLKEEIINNTIIVLPEDDLIVDEDSVEEVKVEEPIEYQEPEKISCAEVDCNTDELKDSEDFAAFICDFADPIGPKLTDEDIYSQR